jgi:hypothetical protein
MSRWFRHYAGMMRDDKLVRVAIRSGQTIERVVWIYGAILESAAEIDDGGLFDFDAAEAAYFLRAPESDVLSVVAELAAAGRIAETRVLKWSDRQFQSDRSAPRQAAYRERKRQAGGNNPPSGDANVTSQSRHGDAPETETETEKIKTEPKGSSKSLVELEKLGAISSCLKAAFSCPEGVDPAHWRDFMKNRRTKRLTNSDTAYAGQLKALAEFSDDEWPPGRLVQFAAEKGWGSINDPRTPKYGQPASNITSLRGSRPDPALDLLRAARAAEDRENHWGTGPPLPAIGSSGP